MQLVHQIPVIQESAVMRIGYVWIPLDNISLIAHTSQRRLKLISGMSLCLRDVSEESQTYLKDVSTSLRCGVLCGMGLVRIPLDIQADSTESESSHTDSNFLFYSIGLCQLISINQTYYFRISLKTTPVDQGPSTLPIETFASSCS